MIEEEVGREGGMEGGREGGSAYLSDEEEVALGDGAVGLKEVRFQVHVEQVAGHAWGRKRGRE